MKKGSGILYLMLISGIISVFCLFNLSYFQMILNNNKNQENIDQKSIETMNFNHKLMFNNHLSTKLVSKIENNIVNSIVLYDSRNISNLYKIFLVNLYNKLKFNLLYHANFIDSENIFKDYDSKLDLEGNQQSVECLNNNYDSGDKHKVCWFPTNSTENFSGINITNILNINSDANKIFYLSSVEPFDKFQFDIPVNYKIYNVLALADCSEFKIVSEKNYISLCIDSNNINELDLYEILAKDWTKEVIVK